MRIGVDVRNKSNNNTNKKKMMKRQTRLINPLTLQCTNTQTVEFGLGKLLICTLECNKRAMINYYSWQVSENVHYHKVISLNAHSAVCTSSVSAEYAAR